MAGGAFDNSEEDCRCASRNNNNPDNRNNNIGFRCARTKINCGAGIFFFPEGKSMPVLIQILLLCPPDGGTNYGTRGTGLVGTAEGPESSCK